MMMGDIAISRVHFPVTTLGPGNRIGIWFQGCSIRCPGCISADTWKPGGGLTTVEELVSALSPWFLVADGITVSGGEPFDQPDALTNLLTAVRARSAADILVYSGYSIENLSDHLQKMTGLMDALVSDPYIEAADQTLALRGSDNQRLNILSPLGHERFSSYERKIAPSDRKFDLMMDDDGQVWMAGIPARHDFERLAAALSVQNHKIFTTQDRSTSVLRPEAND